MSPVETAPGRKQREAPLHDRLNRSSDIIPSDADTTAIRKHLGKRASAGAAAAGGIWCKGTVCGSGFLIWLFSLMHERLCSVFSSFMRFFSPGFYSQRQKQRVPRESNPPPSAGSKATRHVTERTTQVSGPMTRAGCVTSAILAEAPRLAAPR